jgi:hypothetical protein
MTKKTTHYLLQFHLTAKEQRYTLKKRLNRTYGIGKTNVQLKLLGTSTTIV